MARINIEECWWSDPRRTALLLNIGFEADSAAVNMWRIAQEFWGKGRGLIPKQVFDKIRHGAALIDAGLADVRESLVYVRGSSEHHEWMFEKRDQARDAGKKSVEARRKKTGTAQPSGGKGHKIHEITERDPNEIRTEPNGSEPSYSSSSSCSEELKQNKELKAKSAKADPPAISKIVKVKPKPKQIDDPKLNFDTNRFIGVYVLAWQKRWRGNAPENKLPRPDLRGKVVGNIQTFLKETPIDRACELIQVYCQMEDRWFVEKCHDFGSFLENIGKVNIALDTGQEAERAGESDPLAFLKNKKLTVVANA
jgi:hypothetical protein